MKDIGEQVRELLPEYPHLWSRVIAWAEKSNVQRAEIETLRKGIHESNELLLSAPSGRISIGAIHDSLDIIDGWLGEK